MERQDLVILAVSAGGSRVLTPVELQKSVFLISKANLPDIPESMYNFVPYHYGPFDADIYKDADHLHEEGLVLRAPSREGAWTDTMITPDGLARAIQLQKELASSTTDQIRQIVARVQSLSFNELLKEVYDKYPEYQVNSVFQPQAR